MSAKCRCCDNRLVVWGLTDDDAAVHLVVRRIGPGDKSEAIELELAPREVTNLIANLASQLSAISR